MPSDDLREAVRGLVGRARDDLAVLVAFRSVADPKQFPPEECGQAAQWVVDTGNVAVGIPTLTSTLRGMTSVDVTVRGLGSAMHSGMFGGPAPDSLVALIGMLASPHDEHGNTIVDGLDATQTWTGVDYPAEQ